jgi:glycosyltransferase involved in cell wall biosynthesis
MCRDKGLDTLVEAFILLRQHPAPLARLRIGGGCGPGDETFVQSLKDRLLQAGLAHDVDWAPNLDRPGKIAFLQSLDVLSVPARSGEAFGLYLPEALAAGVPVVQPRTAAFPEFIEATGGGVLFEPNNASALAEALRGLLARPDQVRALGQAGHTAVHRDYTAAAMAGRMLAVFEDLVAKPFR